MAGVPRYSPRAGGGGGGRGPDLDSHKRAVMASVRIAEVVGQHVELKRAGAGRLKGLCPFHREKSPSFTVNEDGNFYYCFGCGAGGDAIKFLQEVEGLDFIEALKRLSAMAGIAMPEPRQATPEEKSRRKRAQTVEEAAYALHLEAAKFFRRTLEDSEEGRAYAESRGLTPDAIEAWDIGFAPDAWTGFLDWAKRAGFPEDLLVEFGLALRKQETGRVYDRFRRRLIFPIRDARGRIAGFGGRSVRPDDDPKYLNSPETPIYHKGEVLYGLSAARAPIRQAGEALLLEGYMDVVSLWRAGFQNGVATCGTALTGQQADLLKRLCDRVLFLYDADEAGRRAMRKGAVELMEREIHVAVVELPDGHDPDSFAREFGPEAFRQRLEGARDGFDFFLDRSVEANGLGDSAAKARVADDMLGLVAAARHQVARAGFLDRLAHAVESTPAVLLQRLRDLRQNRPAPAGASARPPVPVPPRAPVPLPDIPEPEKAVARLMIEREGLRPRLGASVSFEWFSSPLALKWLSALADPAAPAGLEETLAYLVARTSEAPAEEAALRELMCWRDEDFAATSAEAMLGHLQTALLRGFRRRRMEALAQRVERGGFSAGDGEPDPFATPQDPGERHRSLSEVHSEARRHAEAARRFYARPGDPPPPEEGD